MAGQDLYCVKCSERFIRRIKSCECWVVLAALLASSYPARTEGIFLQWYGGKKCDRKRKMYGNEGIWRGEW